MTMIRINLIAEKKTSAPKVAKREARQASEIQENLILILLVGLAIFTFLVMRHFVKQELATVTAEEIRLKRDYETNWRHWQDKKLDYEIQKELLNEKIQKISDLRDKRQGPVKLMEDVANSLPESVWLQGITQGYKKDLVVGLGKGRKADTPSANLGDPNLVRVSGFAKTTDSITTFANRVLSLDARYREVQLSEIRREKSDDKRFRFEIYFKVLPPRVQKSGEGAGS